VPGKVSGQLQERRKFQIFTTRRMQRMLAQY